MTIFHAILYGVIQGLSEFLPVSSSGHLALLPYILEFKDPGIFFDLMMHVGTAFAVFVYFHKDILDLIKQLIEAPRHILQKKFPSAFLTNFICSTIVSVVFILILKNPSEAFGRFKNLIAFNLIFFGILMAIADLKQVKIEEGYFKSKISVIFASIIGFAQAIAIFPGVSRSGITITASRFLGLSRKQASSYSFLLSLPIILAGAAKKLLEVNFVLDTEIGMANLIAGLIISFLVGFFTIHFFIKLISKTPLYWFSIYRIILGIIILSLN